MLRPLLGRAGGWPGASRVGRGGKGPPEAEGRGGVGSCRAFTLRFFRREPAAGTGGRAGRGVTVAGGGGGEATEGGVGSARGAAIIARVTY